MAQGLDSATQPLQSVFPQAGFSQEELEIMNTLFGGVPQGGRWESHFEYDENGQATTVTTWLAPDYVPRQAVVWDDKDFEDEDDWDDEEIEPALDFNWLSEGF